MLGYLTEVSTTFFYSIDDNMPLKTLAGLSTFLLECIHLKADNKSRQHEMSSPQCLTTANPLRFHFMATNIFTSLHSAFSFSILTIPFCKPNATHAPNTEKPFKTIG